MTLFTPGQRWLSDSEPELGLGMVAELDGRTVTVFFPANSSDRRYAIANAPLSRIVFSVGDTITDRDSVDFEVVSVSEEKGIYTYSAKKADDNEIIKLPETALADQVKLNQPLQRLLAAQVDNSEWYDLRKTALDVQSYIDQAELLGLCSSRTDLIPHQLYIANEVSRRYAPRVLLSDEVGLGKTIEAGLILQQQLFSGLCKRALIVVPESLLHQWLVELLRRFNLAFSLLDSERCESLIMEGGHNPFDSEQLVLCSLQMFQQHPQLHTMAAASNWDLLIVDEAHHLVATEQASGDTLDIENFETTAPDAQQSSPYQIVAEFSNTISGVLLLTATPDQMGAHCHFSLLQLLDSNRFHDFEVFLQEQTSFVNVATVIDEINTITTDSDKATVTEIIDKLPQTITLANNDPVLAQLQVLKEQYQDKQQLPALKEALLGDLLDRHGTGRIVFRNTRKRIAGFPERFLHTYPLPMPEEGKPWASSLYPELELMADNHPVQLDPRVGLVEKLLKEQPGDKFLLICKYQNTALELEEYLRLRCGIRSSVFHEGLSILERDRAAAYFAEPEQGARILVCSEIGSEGRNFQFCQHLILFDLTLNPDQLEQRIGRLDRIGQSGQVNIHVPYWQHSAQEVMLRWYDEGLSAFTNISTIAYQASVELAELIQQAIASPEDSATLIKLIRNTKTVATTLLEQAITGRDKLLELNSFKPEVAKTLLKKIATLESGIKPTTFLRKSLDTYGMETEENTNATWTIGPGEHMLTDHFPVPDEGMTLTFDRAQALQRDDVSFIHWHHPLVTNVLDLILQSDSGKASICILRDPRFKTGTLVMESECSFSVTADERLQAKRFFPSTSTRTVIDSTARNVTTAITTDYLNEKVERLPKHHIQTLVREKKGVIEKLSALSQQLASKKLPELIKNNTEKMLQTLNEEVSRLESLKQVNPNVREEEINFLKQQIKGLEQAFKKPEMRLECIRLILIL